MRPLSVVLPVADIEVGLTEAVEREVELVGLHLRELVDLHLQEDSPVLPHKWIRLRSLAATFRTPSHRRLKR